MVKGELWRYFFSHKYQLTKEKKMKKHTLTRNKPSKKPSNFWKNFGALIRWFLAKWLFDRISEFFE